MGPVNSTKIDTTRVIEPRVQPHAQGAVSTTRNLGHPKVADSKKTEDISALSGRERALRGMQVPKEVKGMLEHMIAAQGKKNLSELPQVWKGNVEKALSALPQSVRDGARYAITEAIKKNNAPAAVKK